MPAPDSDERNPDHPKGWRCAIKCTISRAIKTSSAVLCRCAHHPWCWLKLALRLALRVTLVAYFVFCALFLVLRYAVLPHIDYYQPAIEKLAGRAVGRPLTIGVLDASWSGLQPHLVLRDVAIHGPDGAVALSLPQVSATLSWSSVLLGEVRFDQLTIDAPDLSIRRAADGQLWIAGVPLNRGGNGAGMDWMLTQHEILIRNGRVRWQDDLRGAPELALDQVNLVLRNGWLRHQFSLRATPPSTLAAPLDVRADFFHLPFARKISDPLRWKGELYADLRQTDLSAWKPWFDYPFALDSGSGSVRAWLKLDSGKVENLTADVNLGKLSAQLRPSLQPLHVAQVSGRITAQEYGTGALASVTDKGVLAFGEGGHTIAVSNFSLQMEDGLRLAPTTISETYIPAARQRPEQFTIVAKRLDLDTLANLAGRLPIAPAQRRLLTDLSPKGQLRDFSAQWRGAYPDIVSYRLQGDFTGLSLHSQPARQASVNGKLSLTGRAATPAMPGFDNLSGHIDTNERGGSLMLDSRKLSLQLPMLQVATLPLDSLALHARWNLRKDQKLQVQIDDMKFAQAAFAGSLSGSHLLPLDGSGAGVMDMKAHLDRFDIKQIPSYLPLNMPPLTQSWLKGAFHAGNAQDVNLVLQGDLAHFPFQPSASGKPSDGHFSVAGKFDGLTMEYEPGRFGKDGISPIWPLLENVSGNFAIDRTRLTVHGDTGSTYGAALSDIRVAIPNLLEDVTLDISGNASGPAKDMLRYVNDSPVAQWIEHFTEDTQASGNSKLALKLHVPLEDVNRAKVVGEVLFSNNDVMLQKDLPMVFKARGALNFNEKGFSLNAIKGVFLGEPVALSGGTQSDGTTAVKVVGGANAEGLRKAYPDAAMQRLLARVSGATRFTATVGLRQHLLEVAVDSNLQGLAFDLPAPLRKPAAEALPLHVQLNQLASTDALLQHDDLRLTLGNVVNARFQRQKPLDRHAEWAVQTGSIGINRSASLPASGVLLSVATPLLNLDEWSAFRTAMDGQDETPTQAGAAVNNALVQYLEPNAIAVRADAVVVMGKRLNKMELDATRRGSSWGLNLHSDQATGKATWTPSADGRGAGKISAQLVRLSIPRAVPGAVAETPEHSSESSSTITTQIPALDIVAEDFELFGKSLGRLQLVASNAPVGGGSEWAIDKLMLKNEDALLNATGSWVVGEKQSKTHLTYALDVHNAGKLLDRFGFDRVVGGGSGKMDGVANWNGAPYALDVPSLSGQVQLEMASGQFLKVDSGAAKLLGVLNLQALPRRLLLDFRDVFSQGFAFDKLAGSASIASGVASTDNLKMTGVAATVLMKGTADIVKETQKVRVVVIPEFNLGTASVVATVFNPVIGVGSMLAQLFFRNPLMRSLTYEYEVSGSWSDPLVTKLDHVDAGAVPPPATGFKALLAP
ncbi:YhdP family protein [Herbaspirillum sp. RTI4]|uniref:YhdP family protein n=1 Tax=Herbaspirillum sp. RTI4 TaxID=3048640 RepID=UPI002AB4621A|nr:YhdP family protein [Herbaspirillum sp. RTI4]MDY7578178.1 YhdP family protein [Herbaspirillum sp. RTI4]MEA9981516.1 YhdP family protein [Herbaspirillum sp. RTI4]